MLSWALTSCDGALARVWAVGCSEDAALGLPLQDPEPRKASSMVQVSYVDPAADELRRRMARPSTPSGAASSDADDGGAAPAGVVAKNADATSAPRAASAASRALSDAARTRYAAVTSSRGLPSAGVYGANEPSASLSAVLPPPPVAVVRTLRFLLSSLDDSQKATLTLRTTGTMQRRRLAADLTRSRPAPRRCALAPEIERLGGRVINVPHFDPTCTHVVVGRPSRGEKYLAACAAGKWYAGGSRAATTTAWRATTASRRRHDNGAASTGCASRGAGSLRPSL